MSERCPDPWHIHEEFFCPRCGAVSLDAAWADAEAALPDELDQIAGLTPTGVGGWYAHAYNVEGERCDGIGPTPAAALHALAARLREPSDLPTD